MRYYLAPMEGITGYIYRRAQNALFPAFDKYFSPFLAPRPKKTFNSREVKDILPENNEGMVLVPQILTNRRRISSGRRRSFWNTAIMR